MYNLVNNPILTPFQIKILQMFFASRLGKQFFLTGGTALSAFYLVHRDSKDLDFFSLAEFDLTALAQLIQEIAEAVGAVVETKVSTNTYNEIYLKNLTEG